ncbi:hypothetical protein [Paenibacillus luteus]|nr:hypothetical protein [Paenibacillus luteus]
MEEILAAVIVTRGKARGKVKYDYRDIRLWTIQQQAGSWKLSS